MNRILIDSNLAFTRTALVEDGELNELMFENKAENVYNLTMTELLDEEDELEV